MITSMDEMIEEARMMAKSKRVKANERIRWTRLAGQLIWYKDSILKNQTYEALEVEVWMLSERVQGKSSAEQSPLANPPAGQELSNASPETNASGSADSKPHFPRQ